MRLAALLIALCTIPAIAGAQTADCRSIANSTERLACYDKTTPPAAQQASKPGAKPASAEQLAPLGESVRP